MKAQSNRDFPQGTRCNKIRWIKLPPPYLHQLEDHRNLTNILSLEVTMKTIFIKIQAHFAKVKEMIVKVKGITEELFQAQMSESGQHDHSKFKKLYDPRLLILS